MDEKVRSYLVELLGTFVLVFFGAGAVCAYYLPRSHFYQPEVAGIAMAEGFALAVVLSATFHVSNGCLNPALTLMLWVFKRLDGKRTLGLILAQLLGAVLAGLALRFLFSDEVLSAAHLGTPHLKSLLSGDTVVLGSLLTGFLIEAILTALLTCAVFAALLDPRVPRLGGVLPGMAQTANIVLAFHLTGGSANPARWFGPMVWEFTLPGWQALSPPPLADHAVYWAGPIVGALLGGYLYSALILPKELGRESRR